MVIIPKRTPLFPNSAIRAIAKERVKHSGNHEFHRLSQNVFLFKIITVFTMYTLVLGYKTTFEIENKKMTDNIFLPKN